MTTIRDNTRKPDPQGDDQTQPSESPGEIEGQRGVTSPSQPGRRDRQDPNEYVGGSDDQDQGDDEDMPLPDPQRTGRGESQRRRDVTK